jgi:hypothetical protein
LARLAKGTFVNGDNSAVREAAREAMSACELLATSTASELEAAVPMVIEQIAQMLRTLGYGLHVEVSQSGGPRGNQAALRIETVADLVVRDIGRAAAIARATAAKKGVDLNPHEPLEEDAIGVVSDLFELGVGLPELSGVVDAVRYEQHYRGLTQSERAAALESKSLFLHPESRRSLP